MRDRGGDGGCVSSVANFHTLNSLESFDVQSDNGQKKMTSAKLLNSQSFGNSFLALAEGW